MAHLINTLRDRVRQWARRRQGHDGISQTLAARRIYILPTGLGLVYATMTIVMLLGSMNYNNNLSFLLTFFFIGVGLVAMHQCQRNLVRLHVSLAGMDPVFAGQTAFCRVAVNNPARTHRCQVHLSNQEQNAGIEDIPAGESRVYSVPVSTAQRGWVVLDRFGISSLYPFNLFRAWAWLHMDVRGLVYPAPAEDAPPPPPSETATGHRQHDAKGEEDFAGLRDFHEGDSPRNVAWKAYARNDQLLSKQFSGADTSNQWFDLASVHAPDLERRLSILTRWVIDAEQRGEDYGLQLSEVTLAPDHGETHRHRCLEALALYNLSGHANG